MEPPSNLLDNACVTLASLLQTTLVHHVDTNAQDATHLEDVWHALTQGETSPTTAIVQTDITIVVKLHVFPVILAARHVHPPIFVLHVI